MAIKPGSRVTVAKKGHRFDGKTGIVVYAMEMTEHEHNGGDLKPGWAVKLDHLGMDAAILAQDLTEALQPIAPS